MHFGLRSANYWLQNLREVDSRQQQETLLRIAGAKGEETQYNQHYLEG